uniref:ubiquitinyl hydrolase 1 n=1 Tax=Arcella intermedia TaxID=1963864 RepID=A0A6B2KY63_9EUKA
MKNLGSTCYMNSMLQCMFSVPELVQIISSSNPSKEDILLGNNLPINDLKLLFSNLQKKIKKYEEPTDFAKNLKVDVSIQQDAQEFYQLLLDYLESTLRTSPVKGSAEKLTNLFTGKLIYRTKCQNCKATSDVSGEYNQISLTVDKDENNAFLEYFEDEKIEGYVCEKCNDTTVASRSTLLTSCPPVLTVHLMRFVFDKSSLSRTKVCSEVEVLRELDLHRYNSNVNARYELFSVINHIGSTAHSGHYVSYVKHDSTWWKFDDTEVSREEPNERSTNCAYMLFYRKVEGLNNSNLVAKVEKQTEEEREKELKRIQQEKENRKLIKSILSPDYSPSCWINADWLRRWLLKESNLGKINNEVLYCEHKKLTTNIYLLKRIRGEAWKKLVEQYGGGPEFVDEKSFCTKCIEKNVKQLKLQFEFKSSKKEIEDKIHDTYMGYHFYGQKKYYILASWFEEWKKCESPEQLKKLKGNFTDHIRCEHGNLTTNSELLKAVPLEVYNYFKAHFPHKFVEMSTDDQSCKSCKELEENLKDIKYRQDQTRREQKHNLSTVNRFQYGVRVFYLLSKKWYEQWKAWVEQDSDTEPIKIDNSDLFCKHHKCNFILSEQLDKQPSQRKFVIIEDYTWNKFSKYYEHVEGKIEVFIHKQKSTLTIDEYDIIPESCATCASEAEISEKKAASLFQQKPLRVKNEISWSREEKEIICSYTNTVGDLKLKIFEKLDIPPVEQKLVYEDEAKNEVHLKDIHKTLQEYGVTTYGIVYIQRGNEAEPEMEPMITQKTEKAFEGSLLNTSLRDSKKPTPPPPKSWTCSSCTFENEDMKATVCFVCETSRKK